MSGINCWYGEIWCKCTVAVDTKDLSFFTDVCIALSTSITIPTGEMTFNCYFIAYFMSSYLVADGNYYSTCLMACCGIDWNVFGRPIVPLPDV